ncbi:hypothetical protein SECTIM467_31 [Brevibacillus phage SecTim467]|uniref:Uncharacterized protein n=2 Tax=Jenstvirus jenst TaxID=1982225 RepID=A0A0K2CP30_9CAUD|nr:hypothetical protein AVV11_gp160 [Brevibacillus phage Jenst]ALA07161.1 hypothetical protein JENST_31 [Brevibacillus phage Jenst]ALA07531.1 hypothetical protein SECTIM467_31 [Brevibacillus phage SecTim467]
MGKINVSDVYACIHQTLRNDPEIQSMLGLTADSSLEDMATKIQKRRKPQNLVQDNLPMISFYKNPGARGKNYLEYRFIVDFDIYTQDDVELATNIADRISHLFDDKYLGLQKGSVFKGQYVTSAEDDTDLENTYKYFTQIGLTVGIEE